MREWRIKDVKEEKREIQYAKTRERRGHKRKRREGEEEEKEELPVARRLWDCKGAGIETCRTLICRDTADASILDKNIVLA